MKKLLLILFIVLCFCLVACADAQTPESTTTTTESTSAVATTTVTTTETTTATTETTTATTETTTATTETTTETTTAEPPVGPPIPESFIEFDANGRPILSPEDKSCFQLVTREIKAEDIKALIEEKASLQTFCEKLPLQCIREYKFLYHDSCGYLVPVNTDQGWGIIQFADELDDSGYFHTFVVEDKDKSSADFIKILNEEISYDDLCKLGYKGTILFSSIGWYALRVRYVFDDGTMVDVDWPYASPTAYSINKL